MASAVQNAIRRKKEIEKELGEIEQFLRLHARFAAPVDQLELPAVPSPLFVNPHEIIGGDARVTNNNPAFFAEVLERILGAAGRPLKRSELVAEFDSRGVPIPSADRARYLGTILWRNRDRFVNLPDKGYTLTRLVPEADQKALNQRQELAELIGDPETLD